MEGVDQFVQRLFIGGPDNIAFLIQCLKPVFNRLADAGPRRPLVSRREWGELTEDEQKFVRDTLRNARELLKRRRERGENGQNHQSLRDLLTMKGSTSAVN